MSGVWHPGIEFDVLGAHLPLENLLRDLLLVALALASLALTPNGDPRAQCASTGRRSSRSRRSSPASSSRSFRCLRCCAAGRDGALGVVSHLVLDAGGEPVQVAVFWTTGVLSAFLDNAPTYLVFFNLAGGDRAGPLTGALATTLAAISMGAVYFGALTYIGNAPNFMIKAIAEDRGDRDAELLRLRREGWRRPAAAARARGVAVPVAVASSPRFGYALPSRVGRSPAAFRQDGVPSKSAFRPRPDGRSHGHRRALSPPRADRRLRARGRVVARVRPLLPRSRRRGRSRNAQPETSMDKAMMGMAMAALAGSAQAVTIGFDSDGAGTPPAGWVAGVTGKGSHRWTVEADASAPSAPNVLRQSGVGDFPWCVKKDVALADGFVEVAIQADRGPAGPRRRRGLALEGRRPLLRRARQRARGQRLALLHRARTADHAQVRRRAGDRRRLAHATRGVRRGRASASLLDGKAYIEQDDAHIAGPGAVGVWTKADSVTAFDDFAYGAPPAR